MVVWWVDIASGMVLAPSWWPKGGVLVHAVNCGGAGMPRSVHSCIARGRGKVGGRFGESVYTNVTVEKTCSVQGKMGDTVGGSSILRIPSDLFRQVHQIHLGFLRFVCQIWKRVHDRFLGFPQICSARFIRSTWVSSDSSVRFERVHDRFWGVHLSCHSSRTRLGKRCWKYILSNWFP